MLMCISAEIALIAHQCFDYCWVMGALFRDWLGVGWWAGVLLAGHRLVNGKLLHCECIYIYIYIVIIVVVFPFCSLFCLSEWLFISTHKFCFVSSSLPHTTWGEKWVNSCVARSCHWVKSQHKKTSKFSSPLAGRTVSCISAPRLYFLSITIFLLFLTGRDRAYVESLFVFFVSLLKI